MTLYQGEKQTVITIEPQPDPDHPGKFLIKSFDGVPLCGEFSLKEHAYNVVLSPGSTIIIDADDAEMFAESHSDDHVVFILPTDNGEDFYLEKYFANAP